MALIGSTNAEKIWNFFIEKGLTPFGAAGLLGNIDAESALISTNLQDSFQRHLGYTDATYTASVDNGSYTKERFIRDESGYGICQWTYWTRKKSLYEFAKKTGRSIGDLEMQLEFLFSELETNFPKVFTILKSATSVKEASDVVLMEFERPYNAASQKDKRESFSQKYYAKFMTNKGGSSNMGYKYYTKGVPVKVSEHFYSTEFDCHGELGAAPKLSSTKGSQSFWSASESTSKHLLQSPVHTGAKLTTLVSAELLDQDIHEAMPLTS